MYVDYINSQGVYMTKAPFTQHFCYANILPLFYHDVCVNKMVGSFGPTSVTFL